MAQPTTFKLKSLHNDAVNTIADETSYISAGDLALSHTDEATLTILVVVPPIIGAPSVTSPLSLRLFQKHLRRMSPLL